MYQPDISNLQARAEECLNKGQLEKAHKLCIEIVRAQPGHADAYFLLGIIAGTIGQLERSVGLIERAISFNESSAEYYAHYAKALFLSNKFSNSRQATDRSIELRQNDALTCDTIGTLLCKFGDFRAALTYFEKATELKPDSPAFHFNFGTAKKALGDFEGANRSLRKAIALRPNFYAAYAARSEIGGTTLAKSRITELKALLDGRAHSVNDELMLCHALSMEFASVGDHNQAFAYLSRGNTRKADSISYRSRDDSRLFESLRSVSLDRPVKKRDLRQTPIFILGMPRSGTTVVDRILSNHTMVTSAGELQLLPLAVKKAVDSKGKQLIDVATVRNMPELDMRALADQYLRESKAFVHEDVPYFIDKFPLNFWFLPLITQALPDAKLVCLIRDPLDVCFGVYKTLFSLSVPYYDFSFDLMNAAQYVRNFERLVQTWQTELNGRIHIVCYENLVESPREEIRRILDYCGLPWEDGCMDIQSNAGPVATASCVQVRRPINRDSVGRWKNYRSFMGEVERYFEESIS